jgi:hypothetical protein
MFNQISWGDYFLLLILALVLYYSFVLYKYYRQDILRFISNKRAVSVSPINSQTKYFISEVDRTSNKVEKNDEAANQRENTAIMPHIHDLVQQIKNFVRDVSERSFIKEEVIMGLQIILRDHKNLVDTHFQESINDLIDSECREYCSFQLSKEEINTVWLG